MSHKCTCCDASTQTGQHICPSNCTTAAAHARFIPVQSALTRVAAVWRSSSVTRRFYAASNQWCRCNSQGSGCLTHSMCWHFHYRTLGSCTTPSHNQTSKQHGTRSIARRPMQGAVHAMLWGHTTRMSTHTPLSPYAHTKKAFHTSDSFVLWALPIQCSLKCALPVLQHTNP